jgi:hypothetical protein
MRWEDYLKHGLRVMKIYHWKKRKLKLGKFGKGSLSRPKFKKICSTEKEEEEDYGSCCKNRTVSHCSDTGIMGSNSTRDVGTE